MTRTVHSIALAALAAAIALPVGVATGEPLADPFLDSAIVDYEVGVALIAKNTGRYGAEGTRFDADDTGQRDNLIVAQRISIEGRHGHHRIIVLYAPFDVTTRLTASEPLRFRDTQFAGGAVLDHRYRFDGYRGSYLYHAGRGLLDGRLDIELGGSVQVRNANVSFTAVDGAGYDEQTDIGFVPALKARATFTDPRGPYAMLDADGSSTFGLAGDTEGYLYDVGLTLGIPLFDAADLTLRVRGLGGGATVPDQAIDNRAHFLSVTVGARIDLTRL